MNTQIDSVFPIPILENIISLCDLRGKLSFRQTCRMLYCFVNIKLIPSITKTICAPKDCHEPTYGALDSATNILYFTCVNCVKSINVITGQMDMIYLSACLRPSGLALDGKHSLLYVADAMTHTITRVRLDLKGATTGIKDICGKENEAGDMDGKGDRARLNHPMGLVLDSTMNCLYFVDRNNSAIKKVHLNPDLDENIVETICGGYRVNEPGYLDGDLGTARFNFPKDIAMNCATQEIYVVDTKNHAIRVISLKDNLVRTLCGHPHDMDRDSFTLLLEMLSNKMNQDVPRFLYPAGIALDSVANCIYVSDQLSMLRKIHLPEDEESNVRISNFCGTANTSWIMAQDGDEAYFSDPCGIILDPHSKFLYVMDCSNNRIRRVLDTNRNLGNEKLHVVKKAKKS